MRDLQYALTKLGMLERPPEVFPDVTTDVAPEADEGGNEDGGNE